MAFWRKGVVRRGVAIRKIAEISLDVGFK